MRVLVTGATGFVGRGVVAALLEAGHEVRALARPGSRLDRVPKGAVVATGDVTVPHALPPACRGCEAVVHLVGILVEVPKRGVTHERVVAEATRHVVEAASREGVGRLVFVSAVGTREGAASRYHRGKWAAERAVVDAGLSWTIFRPSVIFGPDPKVPDAFEFVNELVRVFRKAPFVPVLGNGRNRLQPLWRGDLAVAIAKSLAEPRAQNALFEAGGPRIYAFEEIVDLLRRAVGTRKPKVRVPIPLARLAAALFLERLDPPPLTRDQLLMLRQDNVADDRAFAEVFGGKRRSFEDGLAEYRF